MKAQAGQEEKRKAHLRGLDGRYDPDNYSCERNADKPEEESQDRELGPAEKAAAEQNQQSEQVEVDAKQALFLEDSQIPTSKDTDNSF